MADNPKYVLLVEDDPVDFDDFDRLLQSLGYQAIRKINAMPVTSFEDAVVVLKSNIRIEFALIDIQLSTSKTGVDLAEYILKNKYPIKIIFTTAKFTDEVAIDIAYVGTQFGTIPKPSGVVNSEISLFELRQVITPSNPLQNKIIDNLFILGKTVNPLKPIMNQLIDDRLRFTTKVIAKESIYYIHAGISEQLQVPKNHCLIITNLSGYGILVKNSLDHLVRESLCDRFVRINEHTCINLEHYDGIVSQSPKLIINVCDCHFVISKKYRPFLEQSLIRFKLVP